MIATFIRLFFIVIISIFWSSIAVLFWPINLLLPTYHYISKAWAFCLLKVSGVSVKIKGKENIEPHKNYVIISNHASLFDIPILLYAIRNEIKMIAKKELVYIPIFGWSLLAGGYILINRNNTKSALKSIKKARAKLNKRTSILIFPEGTRSENGYIQPFKKGAFLLAFQTKLDLLPISISGSNKVMPKNTFKLNPTTTNVVIDKPINTDKYKLKNKDELIEKIKNIIVNNQLS